MPELTCFDNGRKDVINEVRLIYGAIQYLINTDWRRSFILAVEYNIFRFVIVMMYIISEVLNLLY